MTDFLERAFDRQEVEAAHRVARHVYQHSVYWEDRVHNCCYTPRHRVVAS